MLTWAMQACEAPTSTAQELANADLGGADLSGIIDWRSIASLRQANLQGVRNAPEGFLEWAKQQGAVQSKAESPSAK